MYTSRSPVCKIYFQIFDYKGDFVELQIPEESVAARKSTIRCDK